MCISGDYPCLTIAFDLKRERGYHFIQSYVPSILIVLISWISFWVSSDATAARVSLGVTTVLTMVTMNMAVRNSLPPVSYIKSIDIWTSACLLFVFSALIEFALVNSLTRKAKKSTKNNKTKEGITSANEVIELTNVNDKLGFPHNKRQTPTKLGKIDKYSRVLFPAAFLLFNIAYWITALHV